MTGPGRPRWTDEQVRGRILALVKLSPMTGGEMRRRFGSRRANDALIALVACGLLVRDEGGHYWPTPSGRIAGRGCASEAPL
jgi:hypothetical protein